MPHETLLNDKMYLKCLITPILCTSLGETISMIKFFNIH